MKLDLYSVDDGDNVINKTLGEPLRIDIKLKADIDVQRFDIILMVKESVNYESFNYAYINSLGRYYFIDRLHKVNNSLIKLSLVCDVLESYKQDILASYARLTRNIKSGDFIDASIDTALTTSVIKYDSSVSLPDDEKSIILTTVGVQDNG